MPHRLGISSLVLFACLFALTRPAGAEPAALPLPLLAPRLAAMVHGTRLLPGDHVDVPGLVSAELRLLGFQATDPVAGSLALHVPPAGLAAVLVGDDGSEEYGGTAPDRLIDVSPRSGANAFEAQAGLFAQTGRTERAFWWAGSSGPLVKDRAWFFMSLDAGWSETVRGLSKVTWQVNPRNKLQALAVGGTGRMDGGTGDAMKGAIGNALPRSSGLFGLRCETMMTDDTIGQLQLGYRRFDELWGIEARTGINMFFASRHWIEHDLGLRAAMDLFEDPGDSTRSLALRAALSDTMRFRFLPVVVTPSLSIVQQRLQRPEGRKDHEGLVPGLSIVWDVTRDGRTAVRGHVGRYTQAGAYAAASSGRLGSDPGIWAARLGFERQVAGRDGVVSMDYVQRVYTPDALRPWALDAQDGGRTYRGLTTRLKVKPARWLSLQASHMLQNVGSRHEGAMLLRARLTPRLVSSYILRHGDVLRWQETLQAQPSGSAPGTLMGLRLGWEIPLPVHVQMTVWVDAVLIEGTHNGDSRVLRVGMALD